MNKQRTYNGIMQNRMLRRLTHACRLLVAGLFASAVSAAPALLQAAGVLDGQTIRILAIGDPVFQVMQKIHDDMEKMAGGKIELEVRPFDVLHQQVLLNAQNQTSSYDIVAVDLPQFGEYKSFLLDLNPLIKESGFDAADFQEAAWTGAQVGGKQLGIPIQPHPEILAYRKDLFAEAGLQPPETTDDVLAAAKKLHSSKPGLAGIAWNGARGTPLGQTFIQVMGSFGQAPIDLPRKDHGFSIDNIQPQNMKPMIDTPAGLATAKYLKALMDYSPPGILNMAWDERVRVFAQGGAAMTYIWSGRSAICRSRNGSGASAQSAAALIEIAVTEPSRSATPARSARSAKTRAVRGEKNSAKSTIPALSARTQRAPSPASGRAS